MERRKKCGVSEGSHGACVELGMFWSFTDIIHFG